jgi:hypothetical protein
MNKLSRHSEHDVALHSALPMVGPLFSSIELAANSPDGGRIGRPLLNLVASEAGGGVGGALGSGLAGPVAGLAGMAAGQYAGSRLAQKLMRPSWKSMLRQSLATGDLSLAAKALRHGAAQALKSLGLKTSSEKTALDDEQIAALLHASPIPFSSLAAMLYEGRHSPDEHFIARPIATALGSSAGGALGGLLGAGLSGVMSNRGGKGISGPQLMAMLAGQGVGSYLGARGTQELLRPSED